MTGTGERRRVGRRVVPVGWGPALRWAAGLAILGAALVAFDVGAVAEQLRRTNVVLAAVAIAGLVAAHLVAVVGWRRLSLAFAGVSLEPWPAVRRYYAGQALGTVTPGNLGADAYRVAADPGGGARLAQRAAPIVVQRLTSVVALGILGVAGAAHLAAPVAMPIVAVGAAVAGSAAATVGLAAWTRRTRGGGAGDAAPGRRFRSALVDGMGLGLAFHALALGLGLLLVVAVDPGTGRWPEVLAALAVARLALAVPLAPHGIGIQEGALALVFVQLGLPVQTAIAAALLNRLATIATALLGVAVLVDRPGPRRSAGTSEPTPPVSSVGA